MTEAVPPNDPGFKLLLMVLELLRSRISTLGEQRRWFLSAVVQLVERSKSLDLCRSLLEMMSKWTLEQKEAFPTVKEKAGILVKMMTFETRDNDALLREYLELIHAIYDNPAFARSELTVRLENAFLIGCRHEDPVLRQRFISIFDRTLIRSVQGRLQYFFSNQSWEHIADHYWIFQVLDLIMGSISKDRMLLGCHGLKNDAAYESLVRPMTVGNVITPLRALLYTDAQAAHHLWVMFFKAAWRTMARKYQEDLSRAMVGLLTREYHVQQASARPNVIQSVLAGALAATPQPELPPHVIKYLGRNFDAWHISGELLQDLLASLPQDDDSVREATQDALAELYSDLSEDDMFYGLWRRRCVYAETNAAISFEQNGMWSQAQVMYEQAQIKARAGVLNFTEAEYSLWEDHWVLCAQKLQQWDILTELAKLEGDHDMLLECAWRLSDWTVEREILEQALDSLSSSATPRRRVFEAYMALLKSQSGQDKLSEFGRICDEAIQLTLRKWHSLPSQVTQAHVPLLQVFQQFVELQEASTIFASLALTNASNLDQRSGELKTLMQTWRERLPNLWDDINAWSDLVAWRQHVFGAVNKAYLPLVPLIQHQGNAQSSSNSYAYRGYHETAWIINRFAHVARKHYLNDVCISSLTKIYTLPNIEIQEAFLKLREQAKSHFQQNSPNELAQGLEVINNTNLMFFAAPQKAEFFTLKGMFMAKLGLNDEANHAFSTAIQMDLNLAKAWTEWGRYNDRMFRDKPGDMLSAVNATSCYLQAAGLYKNSKVRKVLIRVLWLMSCDDSQGSIATAVENYKGDTPIWYWITFIPQLLQSLSLKESKYARRLLMQIAKAFPQVSEPI
jgi:transformation/transcription domain-associated protein